MALSDKEFDTLHKLVKGFRKRYPDANMQKAEFYRCWCGTYGVPEVFTGEENDRKYMGLVVWADNHWASRPTEGEFEFMELDEGYSIEQLFMARMLQEGL